MTQTLETGKKTTLSKVLNPADTVMDLAAAPTVTKGRGYLFNGSQEEWFSYDGIIGNQLQNLVRGLSQTAIPATAGTGLKWIAGTRVKFVAMHDQLVDRGEDINFTGNITFSGDVATNLTFKPPRFASVAARNAAITTPEDGMVCVTEGNLEHYNGTTLQRETADTGTPTPNASPTVAGKVEIATDVEVASGTNTGGTGAQLVIQPSQLKSTNDAITTLSSNIGSKQFTYGETISARDIVTQIPDGTTNGRIYKYIGTSGLQTAFGSTGTPRAYQGCISLSNSLVVTGYVGGAPNGTAVLCAATVSGNTFTWGTAFQYDVFFSGFADTNIVGYDLVTLNSTTFAAIAVYFSPANNQKYVAARAFSVSGTTISAGTRVIIHNPGIDTISYSGSCLVDTNKVAISYVYNSSNHMVAFTVSGTTVTGGTPSAGFGTQGKMCQVSADKIAVSDGSNVRLVTFTGTTPVLGNNLAIGSTYTPRSIRNIGSSFAIFTGTTGGNAQAFIVDCSGATPTKGTTVTVLASSTSDDGIRINNGQVVVLTDSSTSNTKYYYYSYTGTALSLLHTVTTTGVRTGYGMIAQISDLTAISAHHATTRSSTQCIFMSDRKYYCQGIAKESGIANDIKYVYITGGIVTGYTGLVPGLPYNATSSGIAITGDFLIAKSVSSTEAQVILSLNTL